MQRLLDQAAILLLCLVGAYFTTGLGTEIVAAMLTAVCAAMLATYFSIDGRKTGGRESVWISSWICLAYAAAGIFRAELLLFLPAMIYICLDEERPAFKWCWAVPAAAGLASGAADDIWIVLLLGSLAALMQYRRASFDSMRGEYRNMQDAARERSMRLEQKTRELREKQDYEVRLAMLSERNRIAREIHDNVGHLLTRCILQVKAMEVVHQGETEIGEQLEAVRDTLTDAMNNVRNSVHDLHDDAADLGMELRSLAREFTFCPVKLSYDGGSPPREVRLCILGIVKEALSNIARHSDADRAAVTVVEHPAFYQLVIEDNGSVWETESPEGIGLENMRERVSVFHGVFRIIRDSGFRIFVTIPKEGKR